MSEELTWKKYQFVSETWGFPQEYALTADRIYIRHQEGKWYVDSSFQSAIWDFKLLEGVNTLEEAKAAAYTIWRMR